MGRLPATVCARARTLLASGILAAVLVCSPGRLPAALIRDATKILTGAATGGIPGTLTTGPTEGRCLAAHFGYRALKRGAEGEDVWNLQILLSRLGLFCGEPTGYFGSKTESAVMRFQCARRLEQTGVVQGETLEAVGAMLAALEWSDSGYEVKEGDTLESISLAWGIPVAVLARLNGIPEDSKLKPGDRIHIPVPEFVVHEVKKGECLAVIAAGYGVDWNDLAAWNGIRAPYVIHPGDLLVIPTAPAQEGP